jgi:hypothetical protein
LFGDATAVGRVIVVDGRQVEVIGVTGNQFRGVRMTAATIISPLATCVRSRLAIRVVPRAQR